MHSTMKTVSFGGLATAMGAVYFLASFRFSRSIGDSAARSLLRISIIYLLLYLLLTVIYCQF